MSGELVKNRSEIVFLYDVHLANPNGDAYNNAPRVTSDNINIVTDVRLKRTVRDYIKRHGKGEIFMDKVPKKDNPTESYTEGELLAQENIDLANQKDKERLFSKFVDLRLFGCLLYKERKRPSRRTKQKRGEQDDQKEEAGEALTQLGPVQFSIGYSLHPVETIELPITRVIPSKKEKARGGTFGSKEILRYSLICFGGIVNENVGKETWLTEADRRLLLEALWRGTKEVITKNQAPRLLLHIIYKENNFHIGQLDTRIKGDYDPDHPPTTIKEIAINLTDLINVLKEFQGKVKVIEYLIDPAVTLSYAGKKYSATEIEQLLAITQIPVRKLEF